VLEGLNKGEMKLHPDRYEKINRDWLGKLRDWNISRQLWWGHQIPAWYDEQGNIYVPDVDDPMMDCIDNPKYADLNLTQDPDVFDTWFSSNLWPFSTMGWPDTEDPFFKKFYPTQVMVTGYDILFFWVTKMQLAGYGLVGEKPFTDIFLHGLVLDEKGQKMSKSKGNGIDPLEVMDEHGTDALRYAMNYASTHGQDIRWDPRRVEMGRNFNNKLWNATRFAMMNLQNEDGSEGELDTGPPETLADRWIMSRLQQAIGEITTHLENYDLGLASREIYDFVWSEFCDWYLEAAKPELREGNARTRYILKTVLTDIVKMLHPMIPFITAELYEALDNEGDVGYADYPIVDASLLDKDVNSAFKHLQNAIGAVRNLRSEANIPPGQMLPILVEGKAANIIAENVSTFTSLAKAELTDSIEGAALTQLAPDLELKLQLEGVIDVAEYKGRQEKKLAELTKLKGMSEGKLGNARFVDNAPEEVVAEERRRLEETKGLIQALEASIAQL